MKALIAAVGQELKRRDPQHGALKMLRRLYTAETIDAGDQQLLERWAGVLQVPPFENTYPVSRHCPKCNEQHQINAFTEMNFPGGWLSQCVTCGTRRMEFETTR